MTTKIRQFLPYHFSPRGKKFTLYKWENESKLSANPISSGHTFDEAKKECFRLNGEYIKSLNK